jgi:hypothetical protein
MALTKTVEVDREKIISILQRVLNSETGSSVFIPCSSKKEQQDTYTCVVRELKIMSSIDPADAAAITHRAIFKDGRFWVVLSHVEPALGCIYIKSKDGKLTKEKL